MPPSLKQVIAVLRLQEADDERFRAKLHDTAKAQSLRFPASGDEFDADLETARREPFPRLAERPHENGAVLEAENVRRSDRPKVLDKRVLQQQFLQPQHPQHARHVDLRDDEGHGQPPLRPQAA